MSSSIWNHCLFRPIIFETVTEGRQIDPALSERGETWQNKGSWELLSRFNKSAGHVWDCLDVCALATVALRLVKNLLKENRVWQETTAIKAAFVCHIKTRLWPFEKQHGGEPGQHFLWHKRYYLGNQTGAVNTTLHRSASNENWNRMNDGLSFVDTGTPLTMVGKEIRHFGGFSVFHCALCGLHGPQPVLTSVHPSVCDHSAIPI